MSDMSYLDAITAAPARNGLRRALARVLGWPDGRLVALLIALSTVAWWFYASVSWGNLDNVGDMAENVAWGSEWQLGYYKHPPLFAWVATLWFQVFPRVDTIYFALSMANVAVGLVAVWFLAGYFTQGRRRVLAVGLLLLCTFYNIYAFRFNANTVALSTWPVAALAFVRAWRRPTVAGGVLCGLAASLAVLGKYSGGLLLLSLAAWLLATPEGRTWLRTRACAAGAMAFLLAMAPHLVWLVRSDFLPFDYVATRFGLTAAQAAMRGVDFVIGQALQLVLVLAVLAALLGRRMVSGAVWSVRGRPERLLLLALAFGPFAIMLGVSVVLRVQLTQMWGTPLWFALPLFFLAAPEVAPKPEMVRRAVALILAVTVLVPASAPLVWLVAWQTHVKYETEPRPELARAITALWRERMGRPLRIVGGTQAIAETIAFYSADRPSDFIAFNWRDAPWITPERLAREGMAVVCEPTDADCFTGARGVLPEGIAWADLTLARHTWLGTGPAFTWRVALLPPRAAASPP